MKIARERDVRNHHRCPHNSFPLSHHESQINPKQLQSLPFSFSFHPISFLRESKRGMESPRHVRRHRSNLATRCARCLANPHDREYVIMWNTVTRRKIAGTAAPCPNELDEYLARHRHVQVYCDQDGGPEAIKQRRRDRNREKERRKRERKRLNKDGEDLCDDAELARGEVHNFDDGPVVTGQIGHRLDQRLDLFLGSVREQTQIPKIKEEPEQELITTSLDTEKLEGVPKETLGEKEKESKEEDKGNVCPEDVLKLGPNSEGEQPPALFAPLLKKEEHGKPEQGESDPDIDDELEQQFHADFLGSVNQDRERYTQPKPACTMGCTATQRNTKLWKRRMPVSVRPEHADLVLAQRVWTAEAYAAIAERKKGKRRREAAMEEEDEEIREFRDLIGRNF